MIHSERRRENRKILEKAMDYDERIILSPPRKAEIEEKLSMAEKVKIIEDGEQE